MILSIFVLTKRLNLFGSSLNRQFDFRNLSHLINPKSINRFRCMHIIAVGIHTRFVVFAFSSGVFSNLRCAVRILRSHSSTKAKMFASYSIWKRWKTGSLGVTSRAVKKSVFKRSVCDFGHAPKSIFYFPMHPCEPKLIHQCLSLGEDCLFDRPLTVLVNNVCGQVPHRKFLHTFSSDHTKLALATPIASGPIICYMSKPT